MPELPEVETIRRELGRELGGRRITGVEILHEDLLLGGRTPASFTRRVRDRSILDVSRRAKVLLFTLGPPPGSSSRTLIMRVQLRMSGRFWLGVEPPDPGEFRHPGVRFLLDDGRTLHYDDVRRLGGFDLLEERAWANVARGLGPEPLESGFTSPALQRILARRRAPVKNVLLDQRRVAGIGNIYASEALFRAGIDPRRPGGTLTGDEIRALRNAIRAVLREALRAAGTTLRNYRAANGESGRFQARLRVYGRAGAACTRCRGNVERTTQAGRSTFFCPVCQT